MVWLPQRQDLINSMLSRDPARRPAPIFSRRRGESWIDTRPGKHTKNYGKSPFSMGKSTIHGPFSIAMLVYQRVSLQKDRTDRTGMFSNV